MSIISISRGSYGCGSEVAAGQLEELERRVGERAAALPGLAGSRFEPEVRS